MGEIIKRDKSIIPACDVSLARFEEIVGHTRSIEGIGGYKIPATAGLDGWKKWGDIVKIRTNKSLIYDHQKAGTDIPDTGRKFMEALSTAGFDAVIIFPLSGPETQEAWIKSAQDQDLGVIVGGEMTHKKYKESGGGYIRDDAIMEIYSRSA